MVTVSLEQQKWLLLFCTVSYIKLTASLEQQKWLQLV